jgi:hypothetical protein
MNLALRSICVHTSQLIFTCRKNRIWGLKLYFPFQEKGAADCFIVLKNPSPRPGLNTPTLGSMASMLTITPPKATSGMLRCVVLYK